MKLFEELKWRGLIQDISSPDLEEKLNNEKLTFYLGTDPTADSLHVGHLAVFMTAKRLKNAGHTCLLLVGGSTGRIGDPRPNAERSIIDEDVFEHNLSSLKEQVKIFGCDEVVDNYDWSKDINFIDFLRDYGKYFPVNYMLDKDTVRRRLETGITYTEFSYMIMQALDYLWLLENKNCTLQVAGSDQWGNITAGIDLIRRKTGNEVYGFCMPLVLDENGDKIGKSEGNAVWIDKNKTSSYELYQYFINISDSLIINYLKYFTLLSKEEIETIEKEHRENPELRIAQKALTKEIITFLHGEDEYNKALNTSESLFNKSITELTLDEILNNFKDVPQFKFLFNNSIPILDFLVDKGICSSKREAKEMVEAGAILINDKKINDLNYNITADDTIKEKIMVIRKGKKKYYLGIAE